MIVSAVFEESSLKGILLHSVPPPDITVHIDVAISNDMTTFNPPEMTFHTLEGDVVYEITGLDTATNSFVMTFKEDKR